MSARALINVPKTAKRGEVIEIKTLISHVMETGYRHSNTGVVIPARHHHVVSCKYNGEEIFAATLYPAIAANPFVTFHIPRRQAARSRSIGSATMDLRATEEAKIVVE
jgi:sulfur-oxidizing protein SoxZ